MTRAGWRLASFGVGALFVAAWQLIASAHLVSPVFLPGPDRTWNALEHGFSAGTLPDQLWQTVQRMLVGWLFASLAGIVIGACIGLSRPARSYLGPTLEFLRPLPASAVIPLAIAFFGLTDGMVLGVIAFGALWPTLLATVPPLSHRLNQKKPTDSHIRGQVKCDGGPQKYHRCPAVIAIPNATTVGTRPKRSALHAPSGKPSKLRPPATIVIVLVAADDMWTTDTAW